MRDIARRSEWDRVDLFRATSQAMRIHEAIVEKDFWVCWILDYLFNDSAWKDRLVFKGGTSLSKAFGAIERFSEDIDLILDWRLLGYSAGEPWKKRSATKQDAFGKETGLKTTAFLSEVLAPALREDLSSRAGAAVEIEAAAEGVLVRYPRAFSLEAIQPQVRLEIGPLAAWGPNERKPIRPYAAEAHPNLFNQPVTAVLTTTAERTFWEKATILHQEAHRGTDKPLPPRYSRHYYDLYRLSLMPVAARALALPDLLAEVARFKMHFYRCPWARYDQARPGTLRLLPPEHHRDDLEKDYRGMRAMLFGSVPSFEEIMAGLASMETAINGAVSQG